MSAVQLGENPSIYLTEGITGHIIPHVSWIFHAAVIILSNGDN